MKASACCIAVVDDDLAVANTTERLVSHFGYQVTSLSSASQVLSAFEANPEAFELVQTDQAMPNMTGLELARELRRRGVKVPVLLVTGLAFELDAEAVAPPFAVLGKPYRAAELGRVLAQLISPFCPSAVEDGPPLNAGTPLDSARGERS